MFFNIPSSTYEPQEKASYFGCLDMFVQKGVTTVADIFRGSSFTDYYLNSPLQKGFSATCYSSVSIIYKKVGGV